MRVGKDKERVNKIRTSIQLSIQIKLNRKPYQNPCFTLTCSFFGSQEDPVVAAVEQRIADWTHLPRNHGEPIEVLRYRNGQKYDAHW